MSTRGVIPRGPMRAWGKAIIATATPDQFGRLELRDQEILHERFGVDGREPRVRWKIAEDRGVSVTRIRELEDRALRRLLKIQCADDRLRGAGI